MGTTAEKLEYLKNTKTAIREAISYHGAEISDSDSFRSYADKIKALSPHNITKDCLEITPNFTYGDTQVNLLNNVVYKSVLVKKPESLIPENIKEGINIGGILGSHKCDEIIKETLLENVAIGKEYAISRTSEPLKSAYSPISFAQNLTNGSADLTSPIDPTNDSWFAFQTYYNTLDTGGGYGVIGTITMDLGESFKIRKAKICLANANIQTGQYSFIAEMPDRVSLYLSNDGGSFTHMGNFETLSDENITYWSQLDFPETTARYVYIEVIIHSDTVAANYALLSEIKIIADITEKEE